MNKKKQIATGQVLFPLLVDEANVHYISEHLQF